MTSILIAVLSLTLLAPIQTQPPESKPRAGNPSAAAGDGKSQEKAELSALQKRAVDHIDQLSQAAKQIDDNLIKIRVRALIADVLWEYNKDRSRKLFEEVYNATYSLLADTLASQTTARKYGFPEQYLHTEVLRLISRRDPDLAEKLQQKAPEIALSPEEAQVTSPSLQLAFNIIDTDPERAAQIASNSLAEGIKGRTFWMPIELARKDRTLADKLFLQILDSARSDPSFTTSHLWSLGWYAFPSIGPVEVEMRSDVAPASAVAAVRYLELVHDTLLKGASQMQQSATATNPQTQQQLAYEYGALQKLLPYFNRYLPDKAGVIRAHMQYIAGNIPERFLREEDPVYDIEGLLEKARTAMSSEERDDLYYRAASFTGLKGDADKGLSIAQEIKDEAQRSAVESHLRSMAVHRALKQGDVDTAYRYAKDISDTVTYARAFQEIVQVLIRYKDKQKAEENKQRAMAMINEAERFLVRADNDSWKAFSLLFITEAAAQTELGRAFDLIQWTVKALNNTDFEMEKAAKPDSRRLRRSPVELQQFTFDQNFTVLARSDPDRALWFAQSIQKKELSILAQLAVCRGMLTTKPKAENAPARPSKEKQEKAAPGQKGDKEAPAAAPGKKKTY